MKQEYCQQVSLQHKNTFMTCWIPMEKYIRQGSVIKLEDDDKWWVILTLYNKKISAKKLFKKQQIDKYFGASIK